MNGNQASADISWLMEVAIPYFEHSTFGPVLERQEMYYVVRDTDWEDRVTAWPTAEHNSSNREPPSRGLSIRAGAIWSKLQALAERSPQHARALAFAFGHEGATWSRHERGRTVALFELVPAGIAIVERARRAEPCAACSHQLSMHHDVYDQKTGRKIGETCNGTILQADKKTKKPCKCAEYVPTYARSDADRLRVEVTVDFITGGRDRLRRQLITVALREAEALLSEALEMWVAMGRSA